MLQGATGRLSIVPVTVTIPAASHAGAWLRQQICNQAPSPLRAITVNVSPARASPRTPNPCPGPPRRFSKSTATAAWKTAPDEPAGGVIEAAARRIAVGKGG